MAVPSTAVGIGFGVLIMMLVVAMAAHPRKAFSNAVATNLAISESAGLFAWISRVYVCIACATFV